MVNLQRDYVMVSQQGVIMMRREALEQPAGPTKNWGLMLTMWGWLQGHIFGAYTLACLADPSPPAHAVHTPHAAHAQRTAQLCQLAK